MTFAADSKLVARVVPAPSGEQGPRPKGIADIRDITIHMAEGGGTVSWLTRLDGNCSTYVVEYDGDIVQMVPESHWAGSINPRAIRQDNDTIFNYLGEGVHYGRAAVVNAIGLTAANDPNTGTIAIEVEGFAATGPNTVQRASLKALVADIRKRRVKPYPCFGHRDWQNYKPCPGHRIPWLDYGGHAVKAYTGGTVTGVPTVMTAITGSLVPEVPTRILLKIDPADVNKAADQQQSRWLYVWSDHRTDVGNRQLQPNRWLLLTRFIDADTYAVAYEPAAGDANTTSQEMFVHSVDVAKTEAVVTAADCTAAVTAATTPLEGQIAAQAVAIARLTSDLSTANANLVSAATTERERLANKEADRIRAS